LFVSISGFAQQDRKKNELGLTLGPELIPSRSAASQPLDFANSVVFGANYARRLAGDKTQFYLQVPFAAAPRHDISTRNFGSIRNLATLYVTPSLRVQFEGRSRLSPWISAGFGYGLYEGSMLLFGGSKNPRRYTSSSTAQFGAGVDLRTGLKIIFPIRLRGEVRDFYTVSSPAFGIPMNGPGQHNVQASGGIVLSF
jgi:hypothetical protein